MLSRLGKALGNLQMNVAAYQQILTIAMLEEEIKRRLTTHTFFFFVHVKLLYRWVFLNWLQRMCVASDVCKL